MGDLADFQSVFEGNRDLVFRFLFRMTGNVAEAEDLLQETFLAVWRKREQFRGSGSVAGYLRKTAYHLFLNRLAKARRRDELAPMRPLSEPERIPAGPSVAGDGGIDEAEVREFLLARVRQAVDGLPEGIREAFLLFRYEGMTCREIGEVMAVPTRTVESRIRRADEILAQRLSKYRHLLSH